MVCPDSSGPLQVSKLEPEVQSLMELIFDVKKMNEAVVESESLAWSLAWQLL